jgi:threonine dehydrogenase-like Zn-dependent dehydrogenase
LLSKVPKIVDVRKIEIFEDEVSVEPNMLLVKNICGSINFGTVFHRYRGETKDTFPGRYGIGFEGVGKVVEVGEGVSGFKVGDIIQNMGGRGLREFVLTTPETIMQIPKGVCLEDVAFLGQMRVALDAVRRAHIVLGDSVLIVGCGIIGIAAMQLARLAGAEQVIVSDLYDIRLEVAKKLGADVVINPAKEDLASRIKEVTAARKPQELRSPNHIMKKLETFPTIHMLKKPSWRTEFEEGVDVVIDAANSTKTLYEDFQVCRYMGRVVFLTFLADLPIEKLYLGHDFHFKQIEFISSQVGVQYPGDFQHSFRWIPMANYGYLHELLKSGKLKMKDIISHRFSIEETAKAFEIRDKFPQEVFGILLEIT